jgi:hypothetical protein
MRELRAEDPQARGWLMVPEAAPLLFQAGLTAREKSFQRAVVRLQIALEDACAIDAQPGHVLLCHRGALDALAYWLRNGWKEEEFCDFVEEDRAELLRRYDAVIHMQTTAIGAESHYTRWPDAHRPETPEEAAETDRLCCVAWEGHPNRFVVGNLDSDWPGKAAAAREALSRVASGREP